MPESKASRHRPIPQGLAQDLAIATRTLRERSGLTQEEVAARSQVSVQMVRRLEAGTSNPTLGTLHAIAVALNTNLASLLDEARN